MSAVEQPRAPRVRVLLVDDHRIVRDALRGRLPGDRFHVVGDVGTAAEALAVVEELRPDVVLLDAQLPDRSGADVCAEILERAAGTTVVVVSAYADEETVLAALGAGAHGYLLKDTDLLDLPASVSRALAGDCVLDSRATAILVRKLGTLERPPTARAASEEPVELTVQERKIIELAAEGCSNPQIGARLYLSRHTVKEYLSNAMRKLDATSRVAAVLEAERRGLINGGARNGGGRAEARS